MRTVAGDISRARVRTRAHHEIERDTRELRELQRGQHCVHVNLTHA